MVIRGVPAGPFGARIHDRVAAVVKVICLMDSVSNHGGAIAEFPFRFAQIGVPTLLQQADGARRETLGKVWVKPAKIRTRHLRKNQHRVGWNPPTRPRDARDLFIKIQEI